jgi:hypothetical protein
MPPGPAAVDQAVAAKARTPRVAPNVGVARLAARTVVPWWLIVLRVGGPFGVSLLWLCWRWRPPGRCCGP